MRQEESLQALVLRRVEYGDSDLILTLLTREQGKLSVLARGARRSKKRFAGALGLFTLVEASASAKEKASMWTLQSARVLRHYDALALDVASMAHGSYAIELVRELIADEHPEPELFDLLVAVFESLQEVGPRAGRLRVFELRLLSELGLAPELDRCVLCGGGELERGAHLDPDKGGVVCAACSGASRGYGVRPLSSAARKILRVAQRAASLGEGDALDGAEDFGEARAAMLATLYYHVGAPLKSVEFIAKLQNSR